MGAVPSRANGSATRAARQPASTDQLKTERSVLVDQHFALLRQCIAECGYTLDALATEMSHHLPKPIDKGYLWRLLNESTKHGEWKVMHDIALPDDVEALLRQRQAEAFGRIVVEPIQGEQAERAFVAGFLGLIAPRLPQRASKMAKAELK